MPIRFWVKKTGNPFSISINIDTKTKIGEKSSNKISATNLLSMGLKRVKGFY